MDMIVAIGPTLALYLDMRTRGAMLCLSRQLSPRIVDWACFQPTPLQRKKLDTIFQSIAAGSPCKVFGSEMILAVCVLHRFSTMRLKATMSSYSYQQERFQYTCRRLSTYHKGVVEFDAEVSWYTHDPAVGISPSTSIAVRSEAGHCILLIGGYEPDPYASHTRFEFELQYIPYRCEYYRRWLLNVAMNLPGRIFADVDILSVCMKYNCLKWMGALPFLLGRTRVTAMSCDLVENETHITIIQTKRNKSAAIADFLAHYFAAGSQRHLKVTLVTSNIADTAREFCNYFLALDGATTGSIETATTTTAAACVASRLKSLHHTTFTVDSAMWAFNQELTPALIEVFLETPEVGPDRPKYVIKLSCSFNRDPHYRAQWKLLPDPRKRWARQTTFVRKGGYADGINGQHVWGNFTYMFWLLTGNTWIDYTQGRFKAIHSLCRPLDCGDFIEHWKAARDSSPRRLRPRHN